MCLRLRGRVLELVHAGRHRHKWQTIEVIEVRGQLLDIKGMLEGELLRVRSKFDGFGVNSQRVYLLNAEPRVCKLLVSRLEP